MTTIQRPAYTPSLPPVRCMTPGHQDREGRLYPGGRLCEACVPVPSRITSPDPRDHPDRGEHR